MARGEGSDEEEGVVQRQVGEHPGVLTTSFRLDTVLVISAVMNHPKT